MRFGTVSRRSWMQVAIDLTPLIDVVFLLLLFFLLTAAPAPDPTLDVQLPHAQGSQSPVGQEVVIVMKSDGALYVEGSQVDLRGLEAYLQQVATTKNTRVVLKGDRSARYDIFVAVLEITATLGLPLHVAVESTHINKDTP